MSSSPDRPYATLSAFELDARITANLTSQTVVMGSRNAAAKRVLSSLRRSLAELLAEQSHREWLAMDLTFPIPKIDADRSIVREVSSGDCRLTDGGNAVCAEGNETAARLSRA